MDSNSNEYLESEKYRSLCYKQLGILLGSPAITITFGFFFYDVENNNLHIKIILSTIFLIIGLKMIDKGYNILLDLNKRT